MSDIDPLLSAVRGRRSIRRFRSSPVDEELLLRLIEAAAWAPSAGNRQDWFFSVVASQDVKRRMGLSVTRRWDAIVDANRTHGAIDEVARYVAGFGDFADAPAVIVVSARRPDAFQKHLLGEDAPAAFGAVCSAAMAAQNLMLAAHAMGLGSCCMTGALAARDELGEIVELDSKREIVCLIAVGWPDEAPPAPARKTASEIARFWT